MPQSDPDGYTEFGGGIIDEKLDPSSNPPTLPQGEPVKVQLTVSNEEGSTTSYTVAVQLQKYENTGSDGDESLEVVNRQTLTQSSLTVEDGTRKSVTPSVTLDETGENYRVMFLLYKSETPETLSEETAAESFVIPVEITSAE